MCLSTKRSLLLRESIPGGMKSIKQWVCYKAIDSNREENRLGFEKAIQYKDTNKLSDIGFLFTNEDDFVGIDIDAYVDEDGQFNQVAEEIT